MGFLKQKHSRQHDHAHHHDHPDTTRSRTASVSDANGSSGADVPPEQKAGWTSFIKQLAHMTGDLSSMTAPPCESQSLGALSLE